LLESRATPGNSASNNISLQWDRLKNIILQAAEEAVRKTEKKYKNRGRIIWNQEIAGTIRGKKEPYLKHIHNNSPEI
jgi:hypothetical protein